MLMPKKTKYRKQMKGRMKGTETRGVDFEFGRYALRALEPGWITSRQIEAANDKFAGRRGKRKAVETK